MDYVALSITIILFAAAHTMVLAGPSNNSIFRLIGGVPRTWSALLVCSYGG